LAIISNDQTQNEDENHDFKDKNTRKFKSKMERRVPLARLPMSEKRPGPFTISPAKKREKQGEIKWREEREREDC